MPIILESWRDSAGKEYNDFLGMACDWFAFFSLVWRDHREFHDSAFEIRRALNNQEANRRRSSHWPGTYISSAKPEATIISYRIDSGSQSILARPESLFGWIPPGFPEDLAFYQQDGRLAFATSAHERIAWAIDLDFGYSLPKHLGFEPREIESLAREGGFDYTA